MDEPVVLAHENRLHHIHMHDVMGKKDHQALGSGEVDLQKYFDLAEEHNCTALLETKTIAGLRQSAAWKQQWR
jgi:sugar phosphate isomerase/epimerase